MSKKLLISKSNLQELYSNKKLSTRKIANILGCEHTAIRNRLKEYNITIRKPKEKINVRREDLYELYIKQNLSISKVAKLLGLSHACTYDKLKESNIILRNKNLFKISKEELDNLYLKEKLSCLKIAKLYKVNNVTVFNKLKKFNIPTRKYLESNIKYPKKEFNGNDELKSYMIGFRLGDLNVKSLKKEATVVVKSSTTKEDQVNLIKNVYGIYGHFWVKRYGEVYSTMTFLDKSFNFLVKKEDNVEDWIMQRDELFYPFLAGYTDAEGNISISQGRVRFRIRSYDKRILKQIYEKLNSTGIKAKYSLASKAGVYSGTKHNKDCWGVFVYSKEDLLKLFSLIKPHMKHAKRINDLINGQNNILERNKRSQNLTIL